MMHSQIIWNDVDTVYIYVDTLQNLTYVAHMFDMHECGHMSTQCKNMYTYVDTIHHHFIAISEAYTCLGTCQHGVNIC